MMKTRYTLFWSRQISPPQPCDKQYYIYFRRIYAVNQFFVIDTFIYCFMCVFIVIQAIYMHHVSKQMCGRIILVDCHLAIRAQTINYWSEHPSSKTREIECGFGLCEKLSVFVFIFVVSCRMGLKLLARQFFFVCLPTQQLSS